VAVHQLEIAQRVEVERVGFDGLDVAGTQPIGMRGGRVVFQLLASCQIAR